MVLANGMWCLNKYEIAIVREDYSEGLSFYGFYSEDKILLAYSNDLGNDPKCTEDQWKEQIQIAVEEAEKRNKLEFSNYKEVKIILNSGHIEFLPPKEFSWPTKQEQPTTQW
jgi:hypothetical protein